MRVIGGIAKGRKLRSTPGSTTRPITDRTKESLFNILAGDIHGASLLDLFGGTGSVGIEALSRGADYVRFIDLEKNAILTIRSNLVATNLTGKADVIKTDAFQYLSGTADRQFEYIFIAPPQYKDLWRKAMLIIDQHSGWLKNDGWVIVQIHPREYSALELANLHEFDQRRYGSTLLVFYERE
jgi:16S rRNA (guanine(966)-N(2))-methyltransferase RsmD